MATPTKEFLTKLTDEQLIGALVCDTTYAVHYRREADKRSSRGLPRWRDAVDAWERHRTLQGVKDNDAVPQQDTKKAVVMLTKVIIDDPQISKVIPVVRSCFPEFKNFLPEAWSETDLIEEARKFKLTPQDQPKWDKVIRFYKDYSAKGGAYTGDEEEFLNIMWGK